MLKNLRRASVLVFTRRRTLNPKTLKTLNPKAENTAYTQYFLQFLFSCSTTGNPQSCSLGKPRGLCIMLELHRITRSDLTFSCLDTPQPPIRLSRDLVAEDFHGLLKLKALGLQFLPAGLLHQHFLGSKDLAGAQRHRKNPHDFSPWCMHHNIIVIVHGNVFRCFS